MPNTILDDDLAELGIKCKSNQTARTGYVRSAYTRADGTEVDATVVSPACVDRQQGGVGKCGPGKIERSAFRRKGFWRKGFEKKDGSKVAPTYVSATNVRSVCIEDVGEPGYGPKTLPAPGKEMHLTRFGYGVHKSANERRQALVAASEEYDPLKILRRLNLIRNYQAVPENKEIMSKDVKFMEDLYRKFKEDAARESGKYRTQDRRRERKSRKRQQGGHHEDQDLVITKREVCREGKCVDRENVRETHNVGGKQIEIMSIHEDNIDDVIAMYRSHYKTGPELSTKEIEDNFVKMVEHPGSILFGIKVDGTFQGYAHIIVPETDGDVEIVAFCVNKGYGLTLYTFLEKYIRFNHYKKILVSVKDAEAKKPGTLAQKLNFWYDKGFTAYKKEPEVILLQKAI